ncbi:hypothetical protein CIHG_04112 [Coccidioides immitis H538.4]|uniref:Uncharacterized protein n=3 Tax=Coccidioides immitis TaxID=5501 RepID=A0A0J8QZR9_COCIT|nr:hypothetical protein CIRG_04510 [Coccidioides immitis RMSCC 2394]KMU78394.1 hypothetical protein CISG_07111 [Coccidioides immitis RMSCC 3703]KMU86323.1 hypothetical protein CIHG_04112 [Coccidioides immitis H538.4]
MAGGAAAVFSRFGGLVSAQPPSEHSSLGGSVGRVLSSAAHHFLFLYGLFVRKGKSVDQHPSIFKSQGQRRGRNILSRHLLPVCMKGSTCLKVHPVKALTLEIGVVNARLRDTPAAKLEPQKQSYMATVRSRIGGGKEYEQLSPVMTLNFPNGKIFNFDEALLGVYEFQSFSVSDPQHIKG